MYLVRCDKCGAVKKMQTHAFSQDGGNLEIMSDFFEEGYARTHSKVLRKQLCRECGQAIHDKMVALLDFEEK